MPHYRDDRGDDDAPRRRSWADEQEDHYDNRRHNGDDENDDGNHRESRRRGRFRDDDDELDGPKLPGKLKVAGYLWIVLGILILLSGIYQVVVGKNAMNKPNGAGIVAIAKIYGMRLIALSGLMFIYAGVQSFKGTAHDTLGNGIGSLVFSVIQFAAGVYNVSNGETATVIFALGFGVGLLTAGVLAFQGRIEYLEWRKFSNKKAQSRRRYFNRRDDD